DEAETQEVDFEIAVESADETSLVLPFMVPGSVREEPLLDDSQNVAGMVRYQRWPVSGHLHVVAEPVLAEQPLARLCVRVENLSPSDGAPWQGDASRDEAMKGSCLSTHLLLAASEG